MANNGQIVSESDRVLRHVARWEWDNLRIGRERENEEENEVVFELTRNRSKGWHSRDDISFHQ